MLIVSLILVVIVGKARPWEYDCRHVADKKQGPQAETRAWCDIQRPILSRDLLPDHVTHRCFTSFRVPKSEEDAFKQEPVKDISDSNPNKLTPMPLVFPVWGAKFKAFPGCCANPTHS